MQLVIDIPNKDIPKHQEVIDIRLHFIDGHIVDADGYGFVELPKGHGRILDEKDILDTENNDGGWYDLVDMPEYIAGVKPIIEADKQTPSYLWKCERCGKLIPYMADFCHECAYKLLGEPPKPFDPQESEDAISRQAAIDCITYDEEYTVECLKTLPPVTPQPKWIPVSERLPEKNMQCLVTVGNFNDVQTAMYSNLMRTIDHRIFYQGECGDETFKNITQYVKAWMPLPHPYNGESEG